jgi:creatinine amidohydrolase
MDQILPTATTSDEKRRGAECAVLPVGSFEQNGDYLPLITDTVIASVISRELASAYPLLQLPPVTISCSHEHSAWRGTVSISSSTLHSMIDDIYQSITGAGLTSLAIVNCHGGNYVLANIVQEGNAHGKSMALFPSGADWTDARQSARLATSNHEDMHAGELETSILLHAHPELVRDDYHAADWVADDRRHLLTSGMGKYTQSGRGMSASVTGAVTASGVLARSPARAVPCRYDSCSLSAGPPLCLGRRGNGLLALQRSGSGDPRGYPPGGARRRDVRVQSRLPPGLGNGHQAREHPRRAAGRVRLPRPRPA